MRDLGVLINTNLTWGTHCRGLINKCNRTIRMIKRAVGFNAPVNVTTSLYRTLVRSNLEYCSSVCSPSTVSDTKAIESIQRAATRYILNYPEIKYDQRCTMLHLHPLSYRREITDLLYVFKCIKGYYDVAWHNDIEIISNSSLRSGNAGRVLRMKIIRTECFTRSFFNRIVPMWNALPRQLRDADSIYSFKRELVMHYDNLLTYFDTDNVCTWSGACRCHSCVCNRGAPR